MQPKVIRIAPDGPIMIARVTGKGAQNFDNPSS